GSLQERDHARLADLLAQELGPDAANLLAEPVSNRDGSRTDWYARSAGKAVSLTALPEAEAAELRHRLSAIEERIEALSARLRGSSSPDERVLASALANCLTVPGEAHVYSADGEPVLTAWGYSFADKPGYRGGLARIVPAK